MLSRGSPGQRCSGTRGSKSSLTRVGMSVWLGRELSPFPSLQWGQIKDIKHKTARPDTLVL